MKNGWFFLNEQPYPSSLYEVSPWPQVRFDARCLRIFSTSAWLASKLTVLWVRSQQNWWQTAFNCCTLLLIYSAMAAMFTPNSSVANLVRNQEGFPSVASGPGAGSEPPPVAPAWRECKGCLWRLHKHDDPMHSRVRGKRQEEQAR